SYKTHEDHMQLYEALKKSMNCDHSEELLKDLAEARKKKQKRRDSPKTPSGSPPHQPPPPPLPAGPSEASGSPGAFGSSQVPPPPSPPPSTNQEGTLSSLQHLTKDLSFGDLFFSDKPLEADNDKVTTETEAESMVSVTIQQDTSLIPLMTTPIIDLTSRPESPKVHQLLKATATETTTTTTTTIHPPPSQPQQSTTYSMLMKLIGKL
nr:hypothetical protein [Tanacetum cinerariifolium]